MQRVGEAPERVGEHLVVLAKVDVEHDHRAVAVVVGAAQRARVEQLDHGPPSSGGAILHRAAATQDGARARMGRASHADGLSSTHDPRCQTEGSGSALAVLALAVLGAALAACGASIGAAPAQRPTSTPTAGAVYRDLAYGRHSPAQRLDLYLPRQGQTPYPVVLAIHGGGFISGDKADGQVTPVLESLRRGYAVAAVNYRLSGEATFPAAINDVKAAIRWLRAHAGEYQLDPARFAAWGESAGGNLAALAGTSGDVDVARRPSPPRRGPVRPAAGRGRLVSARSRSCASTATSGPRASVVRASRVPGRSSRSTSEGHCRRSPPPSGRPTPSPTSPRTTRRS